MKTSIDSLLENLDSDSSIDVLLAGMNGVSPENRTLIREAFMMLEGDAERLREELEKARKELARAKKRLANARTASCAHVDE